MILAAVRTRTWPDVGGDYFDMAKAMSDLAKGLPGHVAHKSLWRKMRARHFGGVRVRTSDACLGLAFGLRQSQSGGQTTAYRIQNPDLQHRAR